ncbi:MAG: arylesterase [Sphingomonadaceae bacterium]
MAVRIRSARQYGVGKRLFHLLILLWLACAGPALASERLILALGDSLTAGYQLPADASFPAQLQAALQKEGRQVRVHNAGVSGDTTAQGRARLAWVLNSLKQKPDLAILALGANDMLRGQKIVVTQANLDAILAEFQRREIPVILAGMRAAPNLGQNYVQEYEAIFPALAKKYDASLYPFFLDGVAANPKLQLADGMHPNRAGVARMVNGILPMVRSSLDRLPQ